ncbi:Signal transduction histidine kinase [Chitinophaga jiangningensis]|uniref:Signal transduction histidine kinase n=1 Tax=Chitinophaga jiangningensis TaxID=1419482 RepID=A0A1M7CKS0_9BACT|nr:ATP-binding protein [Chitinophaga jiangningensis]SHL67800.1 Signal transduction histidine kinase [Chitinophaga jiangningensis]
MHPVSEDRSVFKIFTILYAVALTTIALLSVFSQIKIQQALNHQMDDSHVINFAARLRTYSQTLSKLALLLESGRDIEDNRKEFINTLKQWQKSHEGLQEGSHFLNLPANDQDELRQMFEIIKTPHQEIWDAASKMITVLQKDSSFNPAHIRPYVQTILSYEKSYLLGMELIVFDYDRFSKERIRSLKEIEYLVLGLVLCTLMVEAAVIFYPLSTRIRKIIRGLVAAQERAQRLTEQIHLANQEKLLRQETEQRIRSYSIINGEEKERKRIATEIHDGIGQMLTSLRMKLEQIEDRTNQHDPEIALVNKMMKSIITETRRICADLLPSVLEDFGLKAAIEELIKSCKLTSPGVTFLLEDTLTGGPLPREVEIGVFRILQEALNNAMKHAAADTIEVEIDGGAGALELIVRDNGRGFHFDSRQLFSKEQAKKSNGIRNMKERAELLGGSLLITAAPGTGTIIHLELTY